VVQVVVLGWFCSLCAVLSILILPLLLLRGVRERGFCLQGMRARPLLLLLLVVVGVGWSIPLLLLFSHIGSQHLLVVEVMLYLILDSLLLLWGQQTNGGHIAAQDAQGTGAAGGPVGG
jgi:hypothetical protein